MRGGSGVEAGSIFAEGGIDAEGTDPVDTRITQLAGCLADNACARVLDAR